MAIPAASSTKRFVSVGEFQQRRQRFAALCGPGSVAILPAAPEVSRNNDVHYPYRQNSDFYYLTGFEEPESIAVITATDDGCHYTLFVRERAPEQEQWTGRRTGTRGAKTEYGATAALAISAFEAQLKTLIGDARVVYFPFGQDETLTQSVMQAVQEAQNQRPSGTQACQCRDSQPLIASLRVIKSAAEINALQAACDITVAAHRRAMRAVEPGCYEYALEAELLYEFMRSGARSPAYPSIVGAGENACVLHYTDNNARIESDDLILIDAGAEVENYAADVTRTFPASGRFSTAQKAIYTIVLDAQQAVIDAIEPGLVFSRMQAIAAEVIVEGLMTLGILTGNKKNLINKKQYLPYYMHRSGHWLGLDVHDAGAYTDANGKDSTLASGMVLTVEPGIYIAPDASVDEQWRGLGVRIEDDVLVTDTGARVLTDALPKTVADIERWMQST